MQKMLFAEITFGMTDTYMEEKKKKKTKKGQTSERRDLPHLTDEEPVCAKITSLIYKFPNPTF